MRSKSILNSIAAFALTLALLGCAEDNEAKKLGFASVAEMQEIQAKGWHTMQRYDEDRAKANGFASVAEMKTAEEAQRKAAEEKKRLVLELENKLNDTTLTFNEKEAFCEEVYKNSRTNPNTISDEEQRCYQRVYTARKAKEAQLSKDCYAQEQMAKEACASAGNIGECIKIKFPEIYTGMVISRCMSIHAK